MVQWLRKDETQPDQQGQRVAKITPDTVQALGSGSVNGLWEEELGLYIRSPAEFAEVRKHFRKFTRVQDGQGQWYYVAIWNPSLITQNYHQVLSEKPEASFFIEFIRLPYPSSLLTLSPKVCNRIALTKSGCELYKSPIFIDGYTKHIFKKAKIKADFEDLATSVSRRNNHTSDMSQKYLNERLIEKAEQYYRIGFMNKKTWHPCGHGRRC